MRSPTRAREARADFDLDEPARDARPARELGAAPADRLDFVDCDLDAEDLREDAAVRDLAFCEPALRLLEARADALRAEAREADLPFTEEARFFEVRDDCDLGFRVLLRAIWGSFAAGLRAFRAPQPTRAGEMFTTKKKERPMRPLAE